MGVYCTMQTPAAFAAWTHITGLMFLTQANEFSCISETHTPDEHTTTTIWTCPQRLQLVGHCSSGIRHRRCRVIGPLKG